MKSITQIQMGYLCSEQENITDHGVTLTDLKYVTREFHKKNKKSQIKSGDLLIARHGSNGQANVYKGPEAQCLNAVVIVPNQEIVKSEFLAALINSDIVKQQIEKTLLVQRRGWLILRASQISLYKYQAYLFKIYMRTLYFKLTNRN